MDIMPGITFPVDGRRVYKESWDYEQEQKARAMAQRIKDILSAGVQSGGNVVVAGVGTIAVQPTIAYDDDGHRIEVTVDSAFVFSLSGTFKICLRHLFSSTPGHEPDMHGTIVAHRADFFEIVARDGALLPGDVPLREITNSGGTVAIGADLRVKRNLSISGDALIEGSLRVIGQATEFETTNQKIKDNIITLNAGEPGPGVTLRYSGYDVDRGAGQARYRHVFDEQIDRFVAGAEGSESPIIRDAELNYMNVLFGTASQINFKRVGNYLYWKLVSDADNTENWRPFA